MEDQEKTEPQKTEPEEAGDQFEDEVSDHILSLTSAFNSLMEVDGKLLSKGRQSKLAKMKRQIFDALVYYCDCLPEPEKKDEGKLESEADESENV